MKRFLVILGVTALVWLGVSMSAEGEYPMSVRVEMVGFDTVRYAVVSADTVLPLKVTMSGFDAFLNSHRQQSVQVKVSQEMESIAVSSLRATLLHDIIGAKAVTSSVDSLHVVLAPRGQRTYRPSLDDVDFSFKEQYGLYGEPTITPDEITLYGPDEVLARIDQVKVAATTIHNIGESATFRLSLDPVWLQYADVHPSATEVSVDITVLDADTSVTLRLYPEQATVRAWVAQRDLFREPQLTVVVDYKDILLNDGHLTPRLLNFPSYMRPRNIEPREVQCVVIQ